MRLKLSYLKIDDEINCYKYSRIMFRFSQLLHKSQVIAVNVNNKTRHEFITFGEYKRRFSSRKIRQACHKTKLIRGNEKDKNVMMQDSQHSS